MAAGNTVIGSTLVINGQFNSEEDVSVEGTVKGRIDTTADLQIESGGTVEAEVSTRNIDVRGEVVGNVTASEKFEIHVGGVVTGDIRAPRVVLADVKEERGREIAAEIGDAARFVRVDVTQVADWQVAVDEATRAFGGIDVLVNTAAILLLAPFDEVPPEAFLRLVGQTEVQWKGKAHFFAVAASMIRRILVDHARAHLAAKRQGGRRITLTDGVDVSEELGLDVLDLEEALVELERLHERQFRVVELRFFGGLGVEETASVMGVSPRTVKGDWRVARAWLNDRLKR